LSYKIIEAMETRELDLLREYTTGKLKVRENSFVYYHGGQRLEFSFPDGDISRWRERGFGFYENSFAIFIEYYENNHYDGVFDMYFTEKDDGKWKLDSIERDI